MAEYTAYDWCVQDLSAILLYNLNVYMRSRPSTKQRLTGAHIFILTSFKKKNQYSLILHEAKCPVTPPASLSFLHTYCPWYTAIVYLK